MYLTSRLNQKKSCYFQFSLLKNTKNSVGTPSIPSRSVFRFLFFSLHQANAHLRTFFDVHRYIPHYASFLKRNIHKAVLKFKAYRVIAKMTMQIACEYNRIHLFLYLPSSKHNFFQPTIFPLSLLIVHYRTALQNLLCSEKTRSKKFSKV